MSDTVSSAERFTASHDGPGEERSFGHALGLIASVILHGVLLLLLVLVWPSGMQGSHGAVQLVPVEVLAVRDDVSAPASQISGPVGPSPAAAESVPAQGSRPPDELGTRLRDLAKLQQSDTERPPNTEDAARRGLAAVSADAEPGRLAALKDFIRVQVERHWSLNLAALGSEDFSIPIQIRISKSGVILKAEIVNTARAEDPVYREAAVSARNAVLSASPLSLPAGHYDDVMELVLLLNPKGTLR